MLRLPRGGLARRFGAPLLEVLDRARGVLPDSYTWLQLPGQFDEKLELDAHGGACARADGRCVAATGAAAGLATEAAKRLHVWKSLRQAQRAEVLHARLLAVHGIWPRSDEEGTQVGFGVVRNLITSRLEDLTHLPGRLNT